MKQKKWVALLAGTALLTAMLAGCGGSSASSDTTAATENTGGSETSEAADTTAASTEKKESYVIANAPKCIGISWWDRMQVGNDLFMEKTGNEVYQTGPAGAGDAAVQVSSIEDAIAAGADAITVIPFDPDSVETTLAKAREQGVVVISHEAENLKNVDYDLEAFVNKEYGAHVMDLLAAEMGEEGEYCIMVGALTMASHQQWTEGALERQKEAYPNMKLVTDPVEGPTTDAAYATAKEVIAKYPSVKGFIGWDMVDPPGIAMAVEEANKAGDIAVTGTCLVSACSDYLTNGTIKTISFWDPSDAGQAMDALAVKVLNGEEITDGLDLGVPGFEECTLNGNIIYGKAWVDVTKDNMADYNF